ncbi:MAG: chromosomal replication initiator protein DnaA [Candidatus Pacebacteria bacterium]|nr:chromosomal replication initiator protein DnaA [Candidatus Paceibacterota bacterium]
MIKNTDTKQLWENTLVDIELSISKANFSTWFKNTGIQKIDGGVVYLGVPNQFVKDWLTNKYHTFILKILRTLEPGVRGLEYIISKDQKNNNKKAVGAKKQNDMFGVNELPLDNFYINKNDNLNPRYTFETFIVGPFNQLAHAAAQVITQKPGIVYNPLFIYGSTGHGKTHLIQSVGNQLKKINSNKKVFYVTSERFAVDYLNSVQEGKANSFKEKYRQYDVLIMDDIQFLSDKEKTQEELFHLFNALYDNNKQIIFSSDKHPNYIPGLEDRLKSRFNAGMIVDIPEPDHESRIAILKAKSALNNFILPDDLVEYISNEVRGNIRELEGLLNSIIFQSQVKGRVPNQNEIRSIIKNNSKPKKSVSTKDVIKKIADFYEIEEGSIYEKTRKKEIVKPRQLIMYILREDFGVSYPSIGEKLGGRDHTTVIHSCEKIKNSIKTDSVLSQEIDQIRALL